jgi:hypothetical protein
MFDDENLPLFATTTEEDDSDLLDIDDSIEPKLKLPELTEHDRFLVEQTQQFKERQSNRRKVESAMALILCSTLTGNIALLFIQWGASWLLAATLNTSIGLASVGFISVGEGNTMLSKAKYLVPLGASFFATNDYRDKQFQAWLGIENYKSDVAKHNYGEPVQLQPEGVLNIAIIVAGVLAIIWGGLLIFKGSNRNLDDLDV